MPALTLLLPPLTRVARTSQLALWLARGDRLPDAKPGRDTALRECFEFIGTSLPTAALTRSLDASDAPGALWLRADPAFAMADAVTARLMACGDLGLSRDECDELAHALRPLFGDGGFPLEAARPDRWYLRCPPESRLPVFADPRDVLGDDLMQHLPRGDNERQWRSLFNEAQVILHNHSVNER
ncbi:MAG TPA: phosphoglycerate mutase, partial [Rudaea sp.]